MSIRIHRGEMISSDKKHGDTDLEFIIIVFIYIYYIYHFISIHNMYIYISDS